MQPEDTSQGAWAYLGSVRDPLSFGLGSSLPTFSEYLDQANTLLQNEGYFRNAASWHPKATTGLGARPQVDQSHIPDFLKSARLCW